MRSGIECIWTLKVHPIGIRHFSVDITRYRPNAALLSYEFMKLSYFDIRAQIWRIALITLLSAWSACCVQIVQENMYDNNQQVPFLLIILFVSLAKEC